MTIKFPEPVTLDRAQAADIMEKLAQRVLACSATEFLTRYDAGEFRNDDSVGVAELVALIPFVR